jgi:predicted alpha/beta superfamily hydrolase
VKPAQEIPTVRKVEIQLSVKRDDDRPVFITGSFNKWKDKDEKYKMVRVKEGLYHIELTFPNNKNPIKYKFLKGGWNGEELDEYGNTLEARIINSTTLQVADIVYRWKKDGLESDEAYLPLKIIIEEDFEIPQLNKKRRIWALVPCDYYFSEKEYPVLYLQDAQNLFDEQAPFGNWAIDQRLAVLKEMGLGDIIIIAIEHGGKDRIKEYSPFTTAHFGMGEGKKYARFLVETLKPYVDDKFRTRPHRYFNGVGGSSMGGLISVFTGLMYPDVFSKWMIFSPSLWVSSEIFHRARNSSNQMETWIYLYGGKEESDHMESDLKMLRETLKTKRLSKKLYHSQLSVNPDGKHNERYWGAEFPRAIKWLFFNS